MPACVRVCVCVCERDTQREMLVGGNGWGYLRRCGGWDWAVVVGVGFHVHACVH